MQGLGFACETLPQVSNRPQPRDNGGVRQLSRVGLVLDRADVAGKSGKAVRQQVEDRLIPSFPGDLRCAVPSASPAKRKGLSRHHVWQGQGAAAFQRFR